MSILAVLGLAVALIGFNVLVAVVRHKPVPRAIACSGGCGRMMPAHVTADGTLIAWTCGRCLPHEEEAARPTRLRCLGGCGRTMETPLCGPVQLVRWTCNACMQQPQPKALQ